MPTQTRAPAQTVAPADVKHGARSYGTENPGRTQAYCGAESGQIAPAWNYVTCPTCYPGNRHVR